MNDLNLKKELRDLICRLGGDFWGVADLGHIEELITEEYGDVYQDYRRGIAVAVIFPKSVVNQLADGPTHTYLCYYDTINARLNDIALGISNFLQRKGYKTFPIPASQRINDSKLAGIFSHRLVAHLAGLGWIGKNSSLINPQVGPRLRLVSILTDAPLISDEPWGQEKCGSCTLCQEACPPQVIKGLPFVLGEALEKRLDAQGCHDYLAKVRQSFGKRICGRCIAACPWGK